MSETPILPDETIDDDAALAMDFALGALGGDALRAAELRLRRDPAFAADVARWQADLGPLVDDIAPAAAPLAVWTGIERELFRGPVARSPVAAAPVGDRVGAALARWRAFAFGATALLAVALFSLIMRPEAPAVGATPPLLAASMASTDAAKAVLIMATYDPGRGAVILTPAAKDASRGLTPELWVIVGDDKPQSLGVIDLHDPAAHKIPDALRSKLKGGATLAISLEPAGGSPTGQPTGPVVATGKLAVI